jgi:hypothetical protein
MTIRPDEIVLRDECARRKVQQHAYGWGPTRRIDAIHAMAESAAKNIDLGRFSRKFSRSGSWRAPCYSLTPEDFLQ